ncbi:MAG: LptF/LptG family permease, partial [Candidatus Eisenbacteria sp.]|nr:LptF/LptG family permease [Candidatus Eisenbacteria bacterium]
MSILSRYVLRTHIPAAAAGLAIFYFVLSMDFIVDYLNLFIAKGVPGMAVLEGFLLSLAWMTVMAVPMAVMVAVLTAFGRLAGDNEITAAKATGVNVFTLIAPVLAASIVIALGLFWFGNHMLPAANHRLKVLLVDIHRIRPLATIEPGILTELPGGYTILVDRLDSRTSEIFDVKIHRMEGGDPLQTIVAERGHISSERGDDFVRLELLNGEIHELDPNDATRFNRLLFERHVINIEQGRSELVRSGESRRGDRELSLAELRSRIAEQRKEGEASRLKFADGLEAHLAGFLDLADGTSPPLGSAAVRASRGRMLRSAESDLRAEASSMRQVRRLEVEYHKKLSIP